MYISTIFTYAGPTWGALISENCWQMLEAVQNIALWTITYTPWYARIDILLHSLESLRESIVNTF